MRLRLALAAALTLACAAPVAASAQVQRPHSTVATYLRDGVHVTTLQLAVRRAGHHLHAHVRLTATATGGATRYLRLGPCTGGRSLAAPTCPASTTIVVHVPAGGSVTVDRTITLRQPPPHVDAVLAELGARHPARRGLRDVNARLLLRGDAWRGGGAGRTYGAQIDGTHVQRIQLDLARLSGHEGRMSLVWNGPDAPSAATTTLQRCTATCTDTPLRSERGRTGPQRFATRPWLAPVDRLGFTVTTADQQLATVLLPWPR